MAAIYPELHEVWPEKLSDDALAHFARSGLGAHRVELAPRNAFGARYVVRTNALAVLEVREGFATYGGDAYFDAGWRPVAIVRAAPAAGQARSEDWYKPLVETVYRPGDGIAWEYAKFCFRASVFCLVTFVDRKGEGGGVAKPATRLLLPPQRSLAVPKSCTLPALPQTSSSCTCKSAS